MSATQVVLIAVAVVIFAAGWAARGRREAHERPAEPWVVELDRTIGSALTAFQAVLALWQTQGRVAGNLAARVIATFEQRRAAVGDAAADLPTDAGEPVVKVSAALDRLASELTPFGEGLPLDADRERGLFRAERELTAARAELLLAVAQARG